MALNSFIEKWYFTSASQLANFLKEFPLTFDRQERMAMLKQLLDGSISKEKNALLQRFETAANLMKLEELMRLSHLRMYDKYTEFQLETTLYQKNDKELNRSFVVNVIAFLFSKLEEKFGSSFTDSVEKATIPTSELGMDARSLNRALDDRFYDKQDQFDGVTHNQFRSSLFAGSTIPTLKNLAEKYNLKIPAYIAKEEVQRRLRKALKDGNQWTAEKDKTIESSSLRALIELGQQWQLNAKTYMTKEEMIEYILEHAESSKATYQKPVDQTVYSQDIIRSFNEQYRKVLDLNLDLVKLRDKGLIVQALKQIQGMDEGVQTALQEQRIRLESLLKRIELLESQSKVKEVTPVVAIPTSPVSTPTPIVNTPSVPVQSVAQSSSTSDANVRVDYLEKVLVSQQKLIELIHRLLDERTTTGYVTNAVSKQVQSTQPGPSWFISVWDIVLSAVILLQVVFLVFFR